MNCDDAREQLQDLRRGRLGPAAATEVRGHLAGCDACRREDEAEELLDRALAERLPRHPASLALRRRVAALAGGEGSGLGPGAGGEPLRERARATGRPRLGALLAPAAAAALAILSAGLLLERHHRQEGAGLDRLAEEAITDHLRLLSSAHPLDVESSSNHEVKPWFEGRLDFAPVVPPDQGELRLLGGAVGYVLDRKAAVMSYALRRHKVTLLAFPAAGLAWPVADRSAGGVPASAGEGRGFHVVLWRAGELGYALVSDVDPAELEGLSAAMAPATRR
ncbi:MAG TPA: zf-HC2 domain-containing protein [Anaeromyxobacter sp.]|nr:zf-HC2 domain-containing protein [Anaeromyxobacter sp.]